MEDIGKGRIGDTPSRMRVFRFSIGYALTVLDAVQLSQEDLVPSSRKCVNTTQCVVFVVGEECLDWLNHSLRKCMRQRGRIERVERCMEYTTTLGQRRLEGIRGIGRLRMP